MSTQGELLARIATLRERGGERIDAPRLAQLEALARRLPAQPRAVQALLRGKVEGGIEALARRIDQAPPAPVQAAPRRRVAAVPVARPACEPLARLNAHIRQAAPVDELASVGRFRRAWSGTRAQDRMLQAASQKPANAGPLNSQMLVLQTLELMGALPGDYVRRFVGYAESLLWLEAVDLRAPSSAAAAKSRRQKQR
jgi:hypothetical protein